jgi:hypothetical protein
VSQAQNAMNTKGNAQSIGNVSQPLNMNPYMPTSTAGNVNNKDTFLIFSNIPILILKWLRFQKPIGFFLYVTVQFLGMEFELFFFLKEPAYRQMILILIDGMILQFKQVILV